MSTCYLKAVDAFLEELIVRRELADNFCFYQPHYDSLQGAWEWARKTLADHASDKREHIYTSVIRFSFVGRYGFVKLWL